MQTIVVGDGIEIVLDVSEVSRFPPVIVANGQVPTAGVVIAFRFNFEPTRSAQPQELAEADRAADDGGWRAYKPLTDSFIMRPDGSLV